MHELNVMRVVRGIRSRHPRAIAPRTLVAALAVVAIATSASVGPAVAKEPPGRPHEVKPQPTRTVPYRLGTPVTPDTDIATVSGVAAWAIDEYLKDNTPLPALGAAFLKAERDYGVNAAVLLAIAMHESGFGTSDIARVKKNLFGYHAYDRDPFRWAETFPSYAAGVDVVAKYLHDDYLVPTGQFWAGYTTLRAVNLAYASGVHWQDGVSKHANMFLTAVPTLAQRHVRFTLGSGTGTMGAGRPIDVTIRWTAARGATLPPLLRFAARWTPVSIVETASVVPDAPPAPDWVAISRKVTPTTVSLRLAPPRQPGLWRLELDIRDVDGQPLPETDHPKVGAATVRVVGAQEALLAVAGRADGSLVASIRAAGTRPIRAAAATAEDAAPALEAWSIPLDGSIPATRLATQPLPDAIGASTPLSMDVPLKKANLPAIIVVRLAATGATRAVPAVALVERRDDGKLVVSRPTISDPRTILLLGQTATDPTPVDVVETGVPGTLAARVSADVVSTIAQPLPTFEGDPTPAPTPTATLYAGFNPVTPAPTRTPVPTPSPTPIPMSDRHIVVRAIAASGPADPATSRAAIPAFASGALQLPVEGFAPGVRLVVAWLEPAEGGRPTSFWIGWLDVADGAR
jgi:hypothetical protein